MKHMEHPMGGTKVTIEEYRRITYDEPADGVAWITMNRPDMRNAQDARMLAELDDAFAMADRDTSIEGTLYIEYPMDKYYYRVD